MFYIFHGDDELTRTEQLAEMRAQMGDPAMADLNTTYLEGAALTMAQLHEACDALPLFSERRVVIVTNFLGRFNDGGKSQAGKDMLEALLDYLPDLSDSLRLFFVEDSVLPQTHPVVKLAQKHKEGFVQVFTTPHRKELSHWVIQRVKHRGGLIEGPAAVALAEAVGENLRLLDSEIEKLITYVGGSAPMITLAHVDLLVPYTGESNVFVMVDAIGKRDAKTALRMLHKLLEDRQEPMALFGMITRQIRILIQVKDMSADGLAASTIASRAGLHPYVAEKAQKQAMNFSMRQLETMYVQLFNTDLAIKTGKITPLLALDTLVAVLCGPPDQTR